MINDLILNYVILFVLLEAYEISWQKAQTIMGMLARMYSKYSKSIFLFLIMQPTFIFSIGFAMITDYNMYAVILFIVKMADILIKIILIEQIFHKRELSRDMSLALLAPINKFAPYIGILVYPVLIILALS